MNDKTLNIHIETPNETMARMLTVAKRIDKGERRSFGNHLSFVTYEQFTAALTDKRMEMLSVLKGQGPLSIRALSKALSRDYKSVHGDVSRLMEIGLIEKREDGLIEAPYDKIISEIRLRAA